MNTLPTKPAFAPSIPTETRRERRRREKSNQSLDNPPVAGSSSPVPKVDSNGKDVEKKPTPNGASSSSAVNGGTGESSSGMGKTTFEGGEDFIPFAVSDPPSEAEVEERDRDGHKYSKRDGDGDSSPRIREKGKGRASDDTSPAKEWAKDKAKGRDRTPPVREWDRGKERDDDRNGGKRKHDMVFDFNDGFANKKQRTDASSRRAPWVAGLDWERCNNVAEMLHNEVEAFVKWVSPTPVEDEVRAMIVALIARAVTNSFPDAQVLPFGSFATKLYLPLGDIDLVILSDSMAYSDKLNVLRSLASTLKRAGITSNVTIISKAKVPIVKFVTTHGRFNVDISINQANGIVAGQIVNGFLKDMHGSSGGMALRALVMITKAFLSQRSMNEVYTGGLGSYSIVCMAVSFLQMHPKIRRGEIDAEKNLGVLVMEFFELYGWYFNYEEVGISVRDGGTYFSKKQRGWYDYYKGGLLSIEDPADVSNDISKGSFGFARVRTSLAGAYGILSSTAYLRAGLISSRRNGRSFQLRGQYAPEDMSILSSIMGITQETINHRRLVQEVFEKGLLHSLLGVDPKSVTVEASNGKVDNGGKPPNSSRSRAARSVQSAWQEADMDHNPEDAGRSNHRDRRRGNRERAREEEEEEGRYDIVRQQPPKKRRKTGRQEDVHTVFTTDDEEEELVSTVPVAADERDENSLLDEEEDVEYAGDGDGDRQGSGGTNSNSKVDERRSYWLSKALGIGFGSDSD